MKKIYKIALSLILMLSVASAQPVLPAASAQTLDGGSCGENCEWVLDSGGTLIITGSGTMNDLFYYISDPDSGGQFPWEKYKCPSTQGVQPITSLVIGNGVTNISTCAFSGCTELTSAQIADSVTEVGEYAFSGCVSLTDVALEGAETILDEAFSGCESLKSFNISKSVKSIGGGVFGGCPNLTLSIDPANTSYKLSDGVLLSFDGNTLVSYPEGLGDTFTIPETVSCIGKGAFSRCESLASVRFHDNITDIRENAFYLCRSLRSAEVANGISSVSAGAFAECHSLLAVILPEGLEHIRESAFAGCGNLKAVYIPSSAVSVHDSAFYGCDSLERVLYGGSAEQWKALDKNEDTNPCLASVPFCETDPYSCGDGLTWRLSADGALSIEGTGSMYGSDTAEFMWKAFRDRITSVEIAEGVENIAAGAFEGCGGIVSVTIPESVESIGENAFGDTALLVDVHYGGDRLEWDEIDIADDNEPLLAADLSYARQLDDSVCGTDTQWVLSDDGTLTISGSGDMLNFDAGSAPWSDRRNEITAAVIESGVTNIGAYAFYGCENLTSIRIPDSVCAMGNGAFGKCTSLKIVMLPQTLKIIPENAFEGCAELEYIRISSQTSDIGSGAFAGCGALGRVYCGADWDPDSAVIGTNNQPFTAAELSSAYLINAGSCGDALLWLLTSDRRLTITGTGDMYDWDEPSDTPWYDHEPFDLSGELLIEDGVVSVGRNAFAGCPAFERAGLPASLAAIGENAFDLTGPVGGVYYEGTEPMLESIAVGKGNDALLGEGVYIRCSVKLDELNFCGANCTWTLSDDGLITVSGSGDMYMYSPDDPSPWHENRGEIDRAVILDGIKLIGAYAFCGCSGLENVSLPDSVVRIGEHAFDNCTALETVSIPISVRRIDSYAFDNCGALKTVRYSGSGSEWDRIRISEGNSALENAELIFDGQDNVSGTDCGISGSDLPDGTDGDTSGSDLPGENGGDTSDSDLPGENGEDTSGSDLPEVSGDSNPERIPGDINGDGTVNNKDLIRLMRYIAGDDIAVIEDSLDVNNDRIVSIKDLTRLMKHLADPAVEIF